MTSLLPLAAVLSLPACSGDPGSKAALEPCEKGMAVTADGEAHTTLAKAVARAIELDGVVDVCPGRHEVKGYLDLLGTGPASSVTIRGAGIDETALVAIGLGVGSYATLRSIRVSGLTIEQSATVWTGDDCTAAGESDLECDSPFERDGYPNGALDVVGSWAFDRVRITQNDGYWGGAVTVFPDFLDDKTTVSFVDSEVVTNKAVESSSGGAVLVAIAEPYDKLPYDVTITSTNTNWGAGDTGQHPRRHRLRLLGRLLPRQPDRARLVLVRRCGRLHLRRRHVRLRVGSSRRRRRPTVVAHLPW